MTADPKGYSLHIGLNFVDPGQYEGWDGALNACEADADDMEALASSLGYTTKKLIREAATRDAVIRNIRAAARSCVAGDIFLFTYSGHGSQAPNAPDGDREIDGDDETWCLYDGQLIDDELELEWHNFAAGVRILLVSDSCHSETMSRAAPPFAGRVAALTLPATRLMPEAVRRRVYLAQRDTFARRQVAAKTELRRRGDLGCTVRTLSGCRDEELSYDGPENGEFTGALLSAWNFGRFEGDYASFHSAIVGRITTGQNPQHNVIGRPNPEFARQKPFAIREVARAASAISPRGDFGETDRRATQAIEDWLSDNMPEELEGVWRERKPLSDWEIPEAAWRGAGTRMIVNFNDLNPSGAQVDAEADEVQNAVRNHHDKMLGEFHQYIVDKADSGQRAARLSRAEASVAEGLE